LLLSQECDSAHSVLEMTRAGTHQGSMDIQESSSRLTVATRNSPSSPLKELSGKLMKSKYVTFFSLKTELKMSNKSIIIESFLL
jgi:hypothetical protein